MTQNPQKKITNLAILMFILSSLFYCYMFFVRVAPGMITRELMQDFSIHATAIGVMSAFFYYAYTGMCIPAGFFLDRFGIKTILTMVTFICALSVLLFGLAPNIEIASLARLLMGASGAFSFICVLYIVLRWFPPCYFALFAGFGQLLGSSSASLSQFYLPTLVINLNWRYSMIILGIAGLILSALVRLFIQDSPNNLTLQKNVKIKIWSSLCYLVTKSQMCYIMLYAFAIWAPIAAFSALWGVPFIKTSEHLLNFEAAKIVSFSWLGIAIGSPLIGWISDKIKRRNLPLSFAALLGCISILCIIFIPDLSIGTLKILMFCFGFSAAGQTLIFAVVKDIIPAKISSTANGLTNMSVVLGGALFQPFIGEILDINWHGIIANATVRTYSLNAYHIAFLVLPICYLLAFIMSTFFIRETRCQEMEETESRIIYEIATAENAQPT